MWYRFANDHLFHSIRTRFADRLEDIPLVKSRAVFQPDQMQDVGFHPYDPGVFLASGTLRQRAEAATAFGMGSYPHACESLLEFLEKAESANDIPLMDLMEKHHGDGPAPGQDIRCAIWSLGQLETSGKMTEEERSRATGLVILRGRNESSWTLMEALRTLEILDPELAADLALEILPQISSGEEGSYERYNEGYYEKMIIGVCAEVLVVHGGARHRPGLRKIIDQYYDPQSWNNRWLRSQNNRQCLWLGRLALQVAATCGEKQAFDEMKSQLFLFAKASGFQKKFDNKELHFGSTKNRYPDALIPGAAILSNTASDGMVLVDIFWNLDGQIKIKDELFRTVAYCPSDSLEISNDFRAVLLSRLDNFSRQDEQMLKDIWHQSLNPPGRVVLPVGKGPGKLDRASTEFNINALAACYALGVQGRIDTLLEFWEQTSWENQPEKAELAMALTLTDDVAAVAPVLEYIRHAWGATAQDSQIQMEMESEAWAEPGRSREVPLDLTYRQEYLNRFLLEHGLDEVWVLIADEDCPSYLKYYLLFNRFFSNKIPEAKKTAALLSLKTEILTPNIQRKIDAALN